MRYGRGRVEALEARQVAAERLHTEITAKVYAETAAQYIDVFERVIARLDLTAEQQARALELLQAELRTITKARS